MATKVEMSNFTCALILLQLSLLVTSYEAEDEGSNAQVSAQVFQIEGKVAVHDDKLKGG